MKHRQDDGPRARKEVHREDLKEDLKEDHKEIHKEVGKVTSETARAAAHAAAESAALEIVYDKQCPACSLYCELVRSTACAPDQVHLLDARTDSSLMTDITRRGLDIDEGMVVVWAGKLHYGADAIHQLALLDDRPGWFNSLNRLLFRRRGLARTLYPLFKSVRNLLLKILRVKRINNLVVPGKDAF